MALVDVTRDQFRSRLRPFGIIFEKSLSDLIKGIRANNGDKQKLSAFFNSSIQECRNELKSNDMEMKSMAILKLTYLEMYGFDFPFMNFQILEVMSSMNFQQKRIGYLAAIQILSRENNDDVLMLMTNLLKKDLTSSNSVEVGLAISCLSSIVTRELAQDVIDDLMKMYSHSKPYIRKKAVLASYKVFLKYPESLKLNYDRLVDKLDDSEDISVVSATVNVVCELAKKNPNNYIDLTPKFFDLLTTSSNNWVIIRLLKLFSSLSLVEPRIKKKLLPAVINLMTTTKASSLMYECINCILTGNMLASDDKKVSAMMVDKLLGFVVTNDQNLKYVSILAFIKIIHIQPELIKKHQAIVLEWLDDEDFTIRPKALELVDGLIDKSNIVNVISKLLLQLANDTSAPLSYRLQIAQKVLTICSSKKFSMIPSFQWYLATLKDLLHLTKTDSSTLLDISKQFPVIGLRVPAIRAALVDTCSKLLMDDSLPAGEWWINCLWCISEYFEDMIEDVEDEEDEAQVDNVVKFITSKSFYESLASTDRSNTTVSTYLSCLFKTYVKYLNKDGYNNDIWDAAYYAQVIAAIDEIWKWVNDLRYSFSFEVQERSVALCELFSLLNDSLKDHLQKVQASEDGILPPPLFLTQGLPQLYNAYELKPIAKALQQRLAVPEFLKMVEAIDEDALNTLMKLAETEDYNLDDDSYYESDDDDDDQFGQNEFGTEDHNEALINLDEADDDEIATKRKLKRLEELKEDPYYITTESQPSQAQQEANDAATDETLEAASKKKKKKRSKKKQEHVMILEEEDTDMPIPSEISPAIKNLSRHAAGANTNKLKFKMDDSKLLGFDLKAELSPSDDNFPGEYEIEKLRKELAESHVSPSPTPEQDPKVSKKKKSTSKKKKAESTVDDSPADASAKPKKSKKVKKRKAVIE